MLSITFCKSCILKVYIYKKIILFDKLLETILKHDIKEIWIEKMFGGS